MDTMTNNETGARSRALMHVATEERLMSQLMLGGDAMARALAAGMDEGCLTVPGLRELYRAALRVHLDGQEVTHSTVWDVLDIRGRNAVGNAEGLMRLAQLAACSATVRSDVELLVGLRDRREMLRAMEEAAAAVASGEQSPAVAMARMQELADAAAERRRAVVSQADALRAGMERLEEAVRHGGMLGVSSGYARLDACLLGLQPGHYYVLGARPGAGKTSFGLRVAASVAAAGGRVLVVTAEMSPERLAMRLACMYGGVSHNEVVRGSKEALGKYARGATACKGLPLAYLDVAGKAPADVVAEVAMEHRREPLALVMVDYLQLLRDKSLDSVVEQVAASSRALCDMGKELGVPVLALAQLNRESARGSDTRRPTLTDLKGSGDIEQDADAVLLLHRPGAVQVQDGQGDQPAQPELIVAKNRDGEQAVIPLEWCGSTYTYTERQNA